MKAVVRTQVVAGAPALPLMDGDEAALRLHYTDAQGVLQGGWSCLEPLTAETETVLVLVEADAATLAAMQADPAYEWHGLAET